MGYCQIMQHVFGRPLHRSTVWRRLARDYFALGKSRHGRREWSQREDESFLRFTGAMISAFMDKGYCHYGDVFPAGPSGSPRVYYQTPARLFRRLSKGGFPPAMMAVAACELLPLNLITRGGPDSASQNELLAKSKAQMQSPAFARVREVLREDGYLKSEIDRTLVDLAKLPDAAQRDEIVGAYLKGRKSNEDRHFSGTWETQSQSSRGTPAYRVDFIGVKSMSRAMASYWRNHRDFRRCKAFLRGLLPKSLPTGPYREQIVTIPKLINARFIEYMKKRNAVH